MTNNPRAAKPARAMSDSTRARSGASLSSSKRLKSGAMKLGTMTCAATTIAIHAAHAPSHQAVPAAPMIQSTAASSGMPISAPRATPVAASASQRRHVMRLKPKRCSRRKVEYHSNGSSRTAPMMTKAATSATS